MNVRLLEPTPFKQTKEQQASAFDEAGNERVWLTLARRRLHTQIERAYYDDSLRQVIFPPDDVCKLPTYCLNDHGVKSTLRFIFTDCFTRYCPYKYEEFQAEWKTVDVEEECEPGLERLRQAILREAPSFEGTQEALQAIEEDKKLERQTINEALKGMQ